MAKKDDRVGEVRCLNCFTRFRPALGVDQAACPQCKMEWRISWPAPKMSKIRGPVWSRIVTPESEKS